MNILATIEGGGAKVQVRMTMNKHGTWQDALEHAQDVISMLKAVDDSGKIGWAIESIKVERERAAFDGSLGHCEINEGWAGSFVLFPRDWQIEARAKAEDECFCTSCGWPCLPQNVDVNSYCSECAEEHSSEGGGYDAA